MLSGESLVILSILIIGAVLAVIYFVTNQIKALKEDLSNNEDVETKVLLELVKSMKTDMTGSIDKSSQTLERQLNQQRETMDKQTKMIWERLDNSSNVIKSVQQQLGSMTELGKDMKDLSNILKSPKLRGGLGEQFLYEILDNILPREVFKTQYKFKDGSVVDAVVFIQDMIMPIDSKFPMENFKAMVETDSDEKRESFRKVFVRDVKKRIDEIATKYIVPEENTTNHAVMYVPSENVFYEAMNSQVVNDYAREKNVVLLSPNYISYYLKTILLAYQQQELQKHAGDILKALSGIKVEAKKFEGDLSVMDKHVSNAFKSMDNVKSKFGKLFGKIENVQALGQEEKNLLEK